MIWAEKSVSMDPLSQTEIIQVYKAIGLFTGYCFLIASLLF